MEDSTKNIDIKLMTNSEKAANAINSNNFRGRTIFDESTIAVASTPNFVNRCRAFAVGFTILEFSKLEMFVAWYDHICKKFPTAKLCASDTDSFIFTVFSKDINKDLRSMENFWDFSTMAENHPLYDTSRRNLTGFFKIETSSDLICACAGNFLLYLHTFLLLIANHSRKKLRNK